MATTPTAAEAAKANAIKNLSDERTRLAREIEQKQARIGVLDLQLNALQNGPTTTVTPATPSN